jgi:hypothetical protein
MLIYISGRIANNSNYVDDFFNAEKWLQEQGNRTINPSNLDVIFPDLTYEQYMALDYKLLEMADAIFMLHDWQSSKGACAELNYAKSLGKKVIYQDYYGRGKK